MRSGIEADQAPAPAITGTPSGTGANRDPRIYLKKGDIIETHIEGIGAMKNRCV